MELFLQMKIAIALVAGLLIVSSVHSAPAVEEELYLSESLKDIIAAIRGRLQVKLDELQRRRGELRDRLRDATGEAREQVRQSLDKVTEEIQGLVKQLLEVIKRAVQKNDETYIKSAVVEKIREYREKAKEILQRVSEIVKREANAIAEDAKIRFEEHKQRLMDQVQRVNEEIKKAVEDIINGKQAETYAFETKTYFIDTSGLRAKIGELAEKVRDLTAKAGAAIGSKRDEILEQLQEVKGELIGAAKDLRNTLREIVGKEPLTYSLAQDLDDVYLLQTVKDLREKLNEKLEQLKVMVEMIKTAHGILKKQIKDGIETAEEQVKDLKDQIIEKVKSELNKPLPQ